MSVTSFKIHRSLLSVFVFAGFSSLALFSAHAGQYGAHWGHPMMSPHGYSYYGAHSGYVGQPSYNGHTSGYAGYGSYPSYNGQPSYNGNAGYGGGYQGYTGQPSYSGQTYGYANPCGSCGSHNSFTNYVFQNLNPRPAYHYYVGSGYYDYGPIYYNVPVYPNPPVYYNPPAYANSGNGFTDVYYNQPPAPVSQPAPPVIMLAPAFKPVVYYQKNAYFAVGSNYSPVTFSNPQPQPQQSNARQSFYSAPESEPAQGLINFSPSFNFAPALTMLNGLQGQLAGSQAIHANDESCRANTPNGSVHVIYGDNTGCTRPVSGFVDAAPAGANAAPNFVVVHARY